MRAGASRPGSDAPASRWPDTAALYEGYTASGQLPVRKGGQFWTPIRGQSWVPIDTPDERLEARQRLAVPAVADLERWMRGERALRSEHAKVAKAISYLLSSKHRPGFTRFLENGRICLSTNAAERSLRSVALGRKSWLFAGSERSGHRAAATYALTGTAKLNGIDPQAWLAGVIARISDMPVSRLHELLPWEWNLATPQIKAA